MNLCLFFEGKKFRQETYGDPAKALKTLPFLGSVPVFTLPPPDRLDKDWFMVFGMGYGLWGDSKNISRIFGHGGIGGSEGLCDREKRLTTGFTCNFGKDVRKVRDLLYAAVGMRWRYGNDKGADIQEIQMRQMGKLTFGGTCDTILPDLVKKDQVRKDNHD